jgi:NitT/TauT family transport system substrate-binding protein
VEEIVHHTRKRIAALSLASLTLAGAAACGGSSEGAGDGNTVTVMMYPGQAYRLPVLVADQKGMFADHGITLETVDQPNNLTGTQGMEATGADVGQLSTPTVVQGWQAGDDFPFFCGGIDVLQTTLLAATDSDLPATSEGASWEEVLQALEGLKIGVQTPVGSGLQLLFAEALAEAGVEDVTYVNLGGTPSVVKAALDNGSVDVAQINPPYTEMLEAEGYGKPLIYLPEGPVVYAEDYGSGWAAPRDWIENESELASEFCAAQTEALKWIADPANKEEAATILAEDTGVPPEATELVVENVYQDFSTTIDEATLQETLDAYAELGISQPEPPVTVDDTYVKPAG